MRTYEIIVRRGDIQELERADTENFDTWTFWNEMEENALLWFEDASMFGARAIGLDRGGSITLRRPTAEEYTVLRAYLLTQPEDMRAGPTTVPRGTKFVAAASPTTVPK